MKLSVWILVVAMIWLLPMIAIALESSAFKRLFALSVDRVRKKQLQIFNLSHFSGIKAERK